MRKQFHSSKTGRAAFFSKSLCLPGPSGPTLLFFSARTLILDLKKNKCRPSSRPLVPEGGITRHNPQRSLSFPHRALPLVRPGDKNVWNFRGRNHTQNLGRLTLRNYGSVDTDFFLGKHLEAKSLLKASGTSFWVQNLWSNSVLQFQHKSILWTNCR